MGDDAEKGYAVVTYMPPDGKRARSVVRILSDAAYLSYIVGPGQHLARLEEGVLLRDLECTREEDESVRVKHWPCVRLVEKRAFPSGNWKVRFAEETAALPLHGYERPAQVRRRPKR